MRTLEYLVDRQYRGIAWKLVRSTESTHGIQAEVDVYDMWARGPDGKPHRFSLTASSSGLDPLTYRIDDDEAISEEEYGQAVHAHGGIRDTATWLAEREGRLKRRRDIDGEISRLSPCCPVCGKQMILRTAGGGTRIFACRNYPIACMGAVLAPPSVAGRIDALREERSKLG